MKDIRLDKYIATCLSLTRSQAKDVIKSKKIKINNIVVTDANVKIKDDDYVVFNDKELVYEENIYLMLNKPKGYVSSTDDAINKTVLDLIEDYNVNRLMIVGRLDIDTTGLLLITSDGAFVHKLTSPSNYIEKKYYVNCDKEFENEDVSSFKNGITIYLDKNTEYKCKSAKLEILNNKNEAYVTISEGKFHQIKKMCSAVGKKVLDLKRIEIGKLKLDPTLKEGEYRALKNEEVEMFE